MEERHETSSLVASRNSHFSGFLPADLSVAAKQELLRLAKIRNYRAGETVLAEGGDIVFVGNVVSGVLRLQKSLHDGRQQIVGLLQPSDMFGRVFTQVSHVAIEAATNAKICCYNRSRFERLITNFPEIEHTLLRSMSKELDMAQDWMLLLATQSVTERIATFLLVFYKDIDVYQQGHAVGVVNVPICRRDMAGYLGTTVESLSRSIQKMARDQIIQIVTPQQFHVIDLHHLVSISIHDPDEFKFPRRSSSHFPEVIAAAAFLK